MPQAPARSAVVRRPAKRVNWFESLICSVVLFPSRKLCGSPPSPSPAADRVRHRTAFNTAMTINTHIAPPVIVATPKIHTRPRHHHRAAVVTSVHVAHTCLLYTSDAADEE